MTHTPSGGSRFLSFHVGTSEFSVAAAEVAEVLRPPKLTRVPLAPPALLGVASLRGEVVPVLSLATLLGTEAAPQGPRSRVLLLELDSPVGVAVDSVGSLAMAAETGTPDGPRTGRGALVARGEGAARSIGLTELIRQEFAGLLRHRGAAEASRGPVAAAPFVAADVAFLSFEVAAQSYALPLAEVAEVLPVPGAIAALPTGGEAMLGVVDLRDSLLPIASLAALLGLPASDPGDRHARIVVARIGTLRLGLLVDRLQTLLRVSPATIDPVPSLLNRGAGEAQIQSLCRLPGGRGLVSILSAERLFGDATIARILAEAAEETPAMESSREREETEQVLVFRLGAEEYGLPIAAVGEVMRLPEKLTRVPRAPAFVEGVMAHRGRVLPVIDPRRRFGLATGAGDRQRVIVTAVEGLEAGFLVDGVSQIVSLTPSQMRPTPELAAEGASLFSRLADLGGGRLVLLIEPRELLDRAERDLLAAFGTQAEDAIAS